MKSRLIFALLFSISFCAMAQQTAPVTSPAPTKPEMPSGSLLNNAPEFSQWVISYHYADDDKKKDQTATASAKPTPDPRPRKVITTKTKSIVHEEKTDGTGRLLDTWFDAGIQYVKHDNTGLWYQIDGQMANGRSADAFADPLPPSGFRNMNLVTPANYAGSIPYGGGHCFVFVPGGSDKLDLSDPDKQRKALELQSSVAYIDMDSRLPVALRRYDETRSYHFNPPPTEVQTLPTELSGQIKKGEEARARLQRPAPRPY